MIDLTDPPYCYPLELLRGDREWITANQRLFWRVRSQRTKAWRSHAADRARENEIPHLRRALIIAELRFADDRRRDPANWAPTAKACVDGLVDAGVFEDDSYRFVTGPDMRIGTKVQREKSGLFLLIYPTERRK